MRKVGLSCALLLLISCAGPYDPFGAVNRFDRNKDILLNTGEQNNLIEFSPERMLFHTAKTYQIKIHAESPIRSDYKLEIFYNGMDVTEKILKQSQFIVSERTLTVTYPLMRLLPNLDHQILVRFKNGEFSPWLSKTYMPPKCPLNKLEFLAHSGPFDLNPQDLSVLNEASLSESINPHFIAGLIAQESSFNSNAVSWAKALGLTQVTPLAEEHIIGRYPDWPRYPGINKMPSWKIKLLIKAGKINSSNEWRLDEKMSVLGGIEYIRYLEQYWSRESNKNILVQGQADKNIVDIYLASYNSGAFRVKKSLMRNGPKWINSKSLKEAKKYVNLVKSYCEEFSSESYKSAQEVDELKMLSFRR